MTKIDSPEPRPGEDGANPTQARSQPRKPLAEWVYLLIGLTIVSLIFGLWGLWSGLSAGRDPESPIALQARIDGLEQQVSTLTLSDQISRDANRDLQVTLAERDEEISALRADVAFYERFVGSTAQRRGLAVHDIVVRAQAGQVWHYTATLTQNLNRDTVSSGRLVMTLEGTQDGQLKRLSWSNLRQQENAAGREYSFKYFQQVEGEIILPTGFEPLRLTVRLVPQSGDAVEQGFSWNDVVRGNG